MNENELREKLADYAHRAWSGWMRYLFSKCTSDLKGNVTIPKELVMRWTRQMTTLYSDLPEGEKASDRKEADEMLAIMRQAENVKQMQFPDNATVTLHVPNEVLAALGMALIDIRHGVVSFSADHYQPILQRWYDALVDGIPYGSDETSDG